MPSQQNLSIKGLLIAQSATTTVTGTSVDLQGTINPGGRNIKVFADIQGVAGTTPSVTIKIQDSPNNTTFTDVTGAAFSAVTTNLAAAGTGQTLHFVTNNRYVRAVATFTSNTTQAVIWAGMLVENAIT